MKKTTLLGRCAALLGLCVSASVASAQITLYQSDIPSIGTTAKIAIDSTTKIAPGAPGTNQSWDFSTLLTQDTNRYVFVDPASTKYASVFTTANLADSIIGIEGYTYFSTSPTSFAVVGSEQIVTDPTYGITLHIELNLSPPFVQSPLPATYNTITAGESHGSQKFKESLFIYDSLEVKAHIIYSDTVDAWGTMKLSTGTFNVLRQKHDEVDIDTVLVHSTGGSWGYLSRTVTYMYQYNWYTKGAGYILVQMNMDSTSATVHNIKWDASAVPTSINELSHSGKVIVYPNPCSTQITFHSSVQGQQYLSVFDITGRKVEQAAMNNGVYTMQTGSYAHGLYLYRLADKSGSVIDEGKFSVQ